MTREFLNIHDEVFDILTGEKHKIIGICFKHGDICGVPHYSSEGYWIDSDYLGGGRHPWEIHPNDNHPLYNKFTSKEI